MKLRSQILLIIIAVASSVIFVTAQPGGGGAPGGGGGPKGPPCQNPPCNPIPITGIEYLFGAGALLGIRYLRKIKKEKSLQI